MLIVETIAKIRRLHFTEGKGIKTICRDLKLSKKVVRKVIRTGITEFTYTRTVQPRPKLGVGGLVLQGVVVGWTFDQTPQKGRQLSLAGGAPARS